MSATYYTYIYIFGVDESTLKCLYDFFYFRYMMLSNKKSSFSFSFASVFFSRFINASLGTGEIFVEVSVFHPTTEIVTSLL